MSIPHCFDLLIGAKHKHPHVGVLSQSMCHIDEITPPSQIPGLNLTQFNNIVTFRPNQTHVSPDIPPRPVGPGIYSIRVVLSNFQNLKFQAKAL